jgi:integrase
MLQAGVPVKVVSERLGHANVAFTLQTYVHVMPAQQREAAQVMGALLRRRGA